MRYSIDYEGSKVTVELNEPPKKGVCEGCRKKVGSEIKLTQLHHHKYVYSKKRVIKEPMLSLENTSEFCFSCHRYANALMNLLSIRLENIGTLVGICKLMPNDMKLKMDKLAELWLKHRKKEALPP